MVFRRTQYVVGYSEPKHVFSLTPTGHRKALEHLRETESDGPGDAAEDVDGGRSRTLTRDRGARAEPGR
jgi:hypothetical protein